ncbi:MAG: two-component regulator propeller domain-containing protein [Bacteroidota bacterium]
MRVLFLLFLSMLLVVLSRAQQGLAFTHFSALDGSGLSSNTVSCLYQDEKGFIWVGTANGLQRFDGSKFIEFGPNKKGGDPMPHASIYQIVPSDSGKLMLGMRSLGEFGVFDPSDFSYKKIEIETKRPLPPRAEFRIWKTADGEIYVNVLRYGILKLDKKRNLLSDYEQFNVPKGWNVYLTAVHEDLIKNQVWFGSDSGLFVYDKATKQTWYRGNNPRKLAILENKLLRDNITQVYIDSKRRMWVFGWPEWNVYKQFKFCFDTAGNFLAKDTTGLNIGTSGFTAYDHFFETKEKDLWIYGAGVLYNYDNYTKRFQLNKSREGIENISVHYEVVFDVIQDKDGSLWIATDNGLYYTSNGSGNMSVINLVLNDDKERISITDLLETKNGELWFATRGNGIKSVDKLFNRIPNKVYADPPPANWTAAQKADIKFVWSLFEDSASGNIWVGCNYGVLLIHNITTGRTKYLLPPECNFSNINYITSDNNGTIWLGTRGGRLIKYVNETFTVVVDIGTIIYKVFNDNDGWLWVSTSGKGLYAINPLDGEVVQHYTSNGNSNGLYSNTGKDIEQLNDSIIAFGAGALNFINKKTRSVRILQYEDGLPTNNVERLRMDRSGFLWIITLNGLCRYNPNNNRITPYGPKDGIVLGEQTSSADFESKDGYVIFTGANSVLMFKPSVFTSNQQPPNVTITDFKIFNQYIPVDSILQYPEIKLKTDQNSFSIYFASLSFKQRDKLTYYYKMEGIDKTYIKADRSYYVNYSLLPPGKYTFNIYCENIEGIASPKITSLNIYIRPPFWRTWWFLSSLLFLIAIIIYVIHELRLNKLLAVENLRHRVARDLHDDMGSTLSTINILSSMAKAKMNTDAIRTSEYLSKISENSQRMMEAMDDIIWSIKPSNDSMQRIAARMREFATSVLEAKDIDLDFNIREDIYEVKLNMEARRDFFLVFKEAINNAAKYSGADKVWVNVTMDNRKLILMVKDNGRGFNIKNVEDGNGLGNMQKRTDHMNGRLNIHSKPGDGTNVTISIPLFQ